MFQDLCEILTEIFLDLFEVLKMSTYLDNLKQYVPEHYEGCSWRTLAILHRLLSMPLHCELREKIDIMRITTAYWTAIRRSPDLGRRIASRSNPMLRVKLESTDLESLWQPYVEFFIMGSRVWRSNHLQR